MPFHEASPQSYRAGMAEEQSNTLGVSNSDNDTETSSSPPEFQSRLRAKREERRQQRHLDEATSQDGFTSPSIISPLSTKAFDVQAINGGSSTSRTTSRSISTADEARRRQRAEARRLLIEYPGTAWDAVRKNDLQMLHNFFLVEGNAKLIRAHSKAAEEFGRTLLHTAAWWGHLEVVDYLITNGALVDEIDSVPECSTKLTPLMDAARAGHANVGCFLLDRGADATIKDSSGDNAFHWAARHANGLFLLNVSLKLGELDHRSLEEAWSAKNVRRRSPADYIRTHASVFPMIIKRLGDQVTLYQAHTDQRRRRRQSLSVGDEDQSGNGLVIAESGVIQDLSRPSTAHQTETLLSGVDSLGIDVGSFAYKSRDTSSSHYAASL